MELKFTINEPGSFFHFLDSVSQWSMHTRKEIREYYEKSYGLSKKDKTFLQQYIKIRKKYPWQLLDSDFYPSKDFKETKLKIKKRLTAEEYRILLRIIKNFYPNIHEIFLEWENHLMNRKKSLELETKKHKLKELFSEIAQFYESEKYPKTIYVHLVINPSEHAAGGGANIWPRKHITLEPRGLKEDGGVLNDIPTIVHETLHLIEHKANKNKWDNFKEKAKNVGLDFEILREAIADTIAPEGYIALKYKLISKTNILEYEKLKKKNKKTDPIGYSRGSRRKLSARLYQLTKKQVEEGKALFDGNYIEKCIKEFLFLYKD
jgi:hypothetical protein